MKFLVASQIVLLSIGGALVGAWGVWTHSRIGDALLASHQCQEGQANLTKELNERIFPSVQKEITDLKAAVAVKVARK